MTYRNFLLAMSISLIFLTPFAFGAVKTKTVTLDVPGMTCKFCPITIRKALEKVQGVTKVTSEYKTKTATVTYDPTKTNVEALTQATKNAGYPSTLKKKE